MADLNVMANNIKTILSKVPGIIEAYDHEPQTMRRLPAVTLYFDGFSQEDSSTRRKSVNWRWVIRIYVPLNTGDVKQPQIDIRTLIENTIKQLRMDPSLGCSCLYHTIADGDVFALLEQANPLMVAEIGLSAMTQEDF